MLSLIALIGFAIVASDARAQQGTTSNLNIGTSAGARSGPQGFTIKQRQIGQPKYEDSSLGRRGSAAGVSTVRSRK
jgi:hypothetical protein